MADRQQGTPDDLHVILTFGGKTLDVVPVADTLSWTTLALGGFGSCSFALPGWWTRTKIPYLANVKLYWGDLPLWEGRVEDLKYALTADGVQTTVQCFGYKRLLDDCGVVRAWIKRDLDWQKLPGGDGSTLFVGHTRLSTAIDITVGNFDPTDLSRSGVLFTGKGVACPTTRGDGIDVYLGAGATVSQFSVRVSNAGPNFGTSGLSQLIGAEVVTSASGDPATAPNGLVFFGGASPFGPLETNVDLERTIGVGVSRIRLVCVNESAGSLTPTSADRYELDRIRILALRAETPAGFIPSSSNTLEDGNLSGGLWGGTILRDLVALVPGLAAGVIESGSDFLIEALTADVRRRGSDVLNEVLGYYAREWGVWEDAQFSWTTPNLDEPQWIVDLADLSGLELDTTIDDLAVTQYVLYTDVLTDTKREASAVSSDQRNPFVKAGQRKDNLTSPGIPMTVNTSTQLATRLTAEAGQFPTVAGTITLPMMAIVDRVGGQARPAAAIRAGENVLIPALPKSDPFTQGRDGQTLFHIVSTNANAEEGTVTLEVEGFTKTSDALLAKLAAVTRNLTG